ncbi:hypothetical protein MSAN_00722000 [Mycena sanguinolenta]|uniref:Uncharacterized protein n=1 Tax=Mycena sanguinolenta TaxID=230812 RepID=A0A8H6Z6V0_9AGAR|nr:hypothetical protein MSAN_00722000 [Mycena sanguinolenta]
MEAKIYCQPQIPALASTPNDISPICTGIYGDSLQLESPNSYATAPVVFYQRSRFSPYSLQLYSPITHPPPNPIAIGSQEFAELSTWGRTYRTAYRARVYISRTLATALESTGSFAENSPFIVALAVATIARELCHWTCAELNLSMAVYIESGHLLETAMWGGIVVAPLSHGQDTHALRELERSFVSFNSAFSVSLDLAQLLNHMKDRQKLSFPLFDVGELDVLRARHNYYDRFCGGEGEGHSRPRFYTNDMNMVCSSFAELMLKK